MGVSRAFTSLALVAGCASALHVDAPLQLFRGRRAAVSSCRATSSSAMADDGSSFLAAAQRLRAEAAVAEAELTVSAAARARRGVTDLFRQFDRDGDGTVTPGDMLVGLAGLGSSLRPSASHARTLVLRWDRDADGVLDLDEWCDISHDDPACALKGARQNLSSELSLPRNSDLNLLSFSTRRRIA